MTNEYTTRDLIELSLLDAMGLLDDDERAAFDRAFSGTSPAIQAHVRREQTRLAQIDFLLPDVEPPADLRAAVLEAVRRAMAEGAVGRESSRAAFMPALLPTRRVSPLWRAGAIGFATAAVVFGYFTVYTQREYDRLGEMIRDNAATDQAVVRLGGSLDDVMFNGDFTRVLFRPTAAGVKGQASLWLNARDGSALLVCRNLPAVEGEYRLVVVDDSGHATTELTTFAPNGFMSRPITVKLASNARLGIVAPGEPGAPASAPILVTEMIGA
jgi:hypothetical protein